VSKKRTQMIGLEYEVEGLRYSYDDMHEHIEFPQGVWNFVHDGTLRGNSGEFVSSPVPLNQALSEVNALVDLLDGEYETSHRCSTHIHLGLAGLVGWQRVALYMLLVSAEDFFFQFEPDRKKNHFCTPLLRSPAFYQSLGVIVNGPDWDGRGMRDSMRPFDLRTPYSANCKYCSVNTMPSSARGIGTIELRHFPPMLDTMNMGVVLDMLERIVSITEGCPTDSSEAVFEYLRSIADQLPDPSAIHWCIAAVDQVIPELPEDRPPPPRIFFYDDHEDGHDEDDEDY